MTLLSKITNRGAIFLIKTFIPTFLFSNNLRFNRKKGAFFLSKKFVDLENSRTFAVG